jgi:hypothetical protein
MLFSQVRSAQHANKSRMLAGLDNLVFCFVFFILTACLRFSIVPSSVSFNRLIAYRMELKSYSFLTQGNYLPNALGYCLEIPLSSTNNCSCRLGLLTSITMRFISIMPVFPA